MFHGVDLGRSLRKMHELEAAHVDRPIQSMSIQLDGGDETQHLCIGRKLDDPALNVVREHAFLRKLFGLFAMMYTTLRFKGLAPFLFFEGSASRTS